MSTQGMLRTNDMDNVLSFFGGLLVGGVAGTVAMLLLVPQSGKKTRAEIRQKSVELRQQTTDAVEGALAQTRNKAHQIKVNVTDQAEAMQQRGRDMVGEQKERLSTLVEASKTAVHDALG